MAKAIFFGIPAHGHVNPTLPLVRELVDRGEEIVYFSTEEFKAPILATGAEYRAYEITEDDSYINRASKDLSLLYYYLINTTRASMRQLLALVEDIGPDYIIHDALGVWGRYVAAIRGIPAVSSITTFAFGKEAIGLGDALSFLLRNGMRGLRNLISARLIQSDLEKEYGVKRRNFVESMMNEEELNIVYTSRAFQPHSELFDEARYKFVGPSIAAREDDADHQDYSGLRHPLIYVSLGTVWKDGAKLEEIIGGLSELNCFLVVSGARAKGDEGPRPDLIVKDHVNQLEILKYCDVFITHGGMNSASEAIFRGVPLCVHPFQAEQVEVADRIDELGCGIRIRDLSKETVKKAVSRILADESFGRNCREYSESFREAGGYRKAAELILERARTVQA